MAGPQEFGRKNPSKFSSGISINGRSINASFYSEVNGSNDYTTIVFYGITERYAISRVGWSPTQDNTYSRFSTRKPVSNASK